MIYSHLDFSIVLKYPVDCFLQTTATATPITTEGSPLIRNRCASVMRNHFYDCGSRESPCFGHKMPVHLFLLLVISIGWKSPPVHQWVRCGVDKRLKPIYVVVACLGLWGMCKPSSQQKVQFVMANSNPQKNAPSRPLDLGQSVMPCCQRGHSHLFLATHPG